MARERAHYLFAQLGRDLARITPGFPIRVLCPLCLKSFSEDAIDTEPPDLTEEHIIPRKLGGTLITLTCRNCNGVHGAKLDSHLIQMLRSQDAIDGVGTKLLRGTIEIGGILLPTDIDWKATKNETTSFRLRRNNAARFDHIRQVFRNGVPNIGVKLKFDYIPHRACLAVLRIAYLVMFREFGYRYISYPQPRG